MTTAQTTDRALFLRALSALPDAATPAEVRSVLTAWPAAELDTLDLMLAAHYGAHGPTVLDIAAAPSAQFPQASAKGRLTEALNGISP